MNTNWRKFTILFAILALMTGMVATSFAQDGGDMGELENPTHITFVNNIEGAPPIDVYVGDVGGSHVVEDLAVGDESAQVDLEEGTYTVSVVPAGALSPVVYETEVELVANTVYQLSVNGSLDALDEVASELTTVEGMDDMGDESMDEGTDETSDESMDEDMDETTDESMDEGTDETTDESMDEGTDETTDESMDEATDETTDESMDEATDETTDESMDEGTDETTDESMDEGTDETSDESMDEDMDETTDESMDEATDEASMDMAETVVDVITGQENLTNLGFALDAVRLTETLSGEGPYTVFAPSDDALGNVALLGLLRNRGTAGNVLLNHVVEGSLTAEDLAGMDGETLTTLAGYELAVAVDGDTVTVGGVAVVEADLAGSNGVVHVIDGVLTPPADDMEAMDEGDMDEASMDEGDEAGDEAAMDDSAEMGTVVDVVAGADNLTALTATIGRDDLGIPVADVLAGAGPYTIFAPNDDAFAAAEPIIAPLGGPSIAGILSTHVVLEDLTLEDLVAIAESDTPELTTFTQITMAVSLDEDGNVVLTPEGGQPGVLTGEVLEASNGRVFVLSSMIIPPPPPGTPGAGGDGADTGADDSSSE